MQIDEKKLEQFMNQVVGELGAAMNAALVLIGDRLGLYKAMADSGPMTPAQLAARTGTDERYVREWLSAQAAGGFVHYDAASKLFTLPNEQAFALAVEDSPAYLPGALQIVSAVVKDVPKIIEAFRNGEGVGWDEHDAALFEGTERFFRPNYAAHLVSSWIPPFAGDRLEENINPVGRVYYSASTMICTPASRAQEVALCLGAQAGEGRLREVVVQGGFSRFQRTLQTPFNLIFEARP